MQILVTGATGFLGSHLVDRLQQQGHHIIALGRDRARMPRGARPLIADLRDRRSVIDACRDVDAVIHAGALSAPWGHHADFQAINVGGTAHVIDGCRAHGVGRLVFVSSPSVLSNGRDQCDLTDDAPYPRRPISIYSATKQRAEQLVRDAPDVPSVIVRPKAIFGPGDTTLLPRLIAAARRGRLPQIGDGQNRVDLTYVENVVHALALAIESPRAVGHAYTITNGEHPRLWDVIRLVLRRLSLPDRLRPVPLPTMLRVARLMELIAAVTRREPLLTRYSVLVLARTQTHDIGAARSDLGYTPIVSLDDGIARTIGALAGADRC